MKLNQQASQRLVENLKSYWDEHNGDYVAFQGYMLRTIANAYGVDEKLLERQVSYDNILSGNFTVTADTRHERPVIEVFYG